MSVRGASDDQSVPWRDFLCYELLLGRRKPRSLSSGERRSRLRELISPGLLGSLRHAANLHEMNRSRRPVRRFLKSTPVALDSLRDGAIACAASGSTALLRLASKIPPPERSTKSCSSLNKKADPSRSGGRGLKKVLGGEGSAFLTLARTASERGPHAWTDVSKTCKVRRCRSSSPWQGERPRKRV